MDREVSIGTIIPYNFGAIGIALNPNYLPCDGGWLLLNHYSELFRALSSKDSVTVKIEDFEYDGEIYSYQLFSLPDLRDSQGICPWIKAK